MCFPCMYASCLYDFYAFIVIVIVCSLYHHDIFDTLWCWYVGWYGARDVDHQGEVATLDLRVTTDHHTILYVGHANMLVNGRYKHYGYVDARHSIVVVVTCMMYVSWSVRSYLRVPYGHKCSNFFLYALQSYTWWLCSLQLRFWCYYVSCYFGLVCIYVHDYDI